jgi:hypothetical protein
MGELGDYLDAGNREHDDDRRARTHQRDRRIENEFTHHPPKGDQVQRYEKLRFNGGNLAEMVMELCPDSRERSTALAKIREAVMWANAAIACNEVEQR